RDSRSLMRIRPLLIVTTVAFLAIATGAHATPIVDQSCCTANNSVSLFGPLTRVQTFTVGTTGLMTGIDVGLEGGPIPTFELFAGAFTAGQDISTFGAPLAALTLADSGVAVAPT